MGIFSVNLYMMLTELGFSKDKTAGEQWLFDWTDMLIKDKFYTIFAILFGIGIAIMVRNSKRKGEKVFPILNRRMLILGLIGFLHFQWIWTGDILLVYALVGWSMIILRHLPWSYLLAIAVIGNLFFTWNLVILSFSDLALIQPLSTFTEETITISALLNTLAYFILGFVAMRDFPLTQWLASPQILRKGCLIFGCLTAVGFIAWFAGIRTATMMAIINLPQSLLYFCLLALICHNNLSSKIVQSISNYGKLAMTHYLSQSLVGIFIISLILPHKQFMLLALLVVLVIIMIQIILSHFWLQRYHYGPIEWLWRWGTYRTRSSFRIKTSSLKNAP